jgi:hypothetical protein
MYVLEEVVRKDFRPSMGAKAVLQIEGFAG